MALTLAAAPAFAGPPATYDGLKKTVSVDLFQAADQYGGAITGEGLTAMLTEALAKDGRFVVVERPAVASVQAEQQLGSSGATNSETKAATGQMIGASAIVRGTVTKYQADAGGGRVGLSGFSLGSLVGGQANASHKVSTIEISLRLIDTTSGQVISTSDAEGSASADSADASVSKFPAGPALTASTFRNTPMGQAAQDAIVKAVDQIAAGMRKVPWSALVVGAADNGVYINAGTDRNVQPGTLLAAYHKGRVLTDPSTGEVLDTEFTKVGELRIDTVREKVSVASLVSGTMPARGDVLKLN